jgi:hypothetical protein
MERDSLVQYSATWLAAGGDASESFRTRLAESAIGLRQYLGKQGFSGGRCPMRAKRRPNGEWSVRVQTQVCSRCNSQMRNWFPRTTAVAKRASRQGMEEGLVRLGL